MDRRKIRIPLSIRVWRFIRKTESCWLWTGSVATNGYGRVRDSDREVQAHRAVYQLLVGPIPDGLQVDHLCRVRNCVNPAHLEAVTQRENIPRGCSEPAKNAAKSECLMGHLFSPENTYTYPDGRRECRTCRRAHSQKHRQATFL